LQKVTINNVAEYAGVSKKTVSRVLNEEPNVSESTLKKVKAAFTALSYKPSQEQNKVNVRKHISSLFCKAN